MSTLKIACATVNQTPLDWAGNFDHIVQSVLSAGNQKVELLCFPELSITGYGSEDLFLSYWYPNKALKKLEELRPYCKAMTVAVGIPVRIDDKVYNCMAIIENTELMVKTRVLQEEVELRKKVEKAKGILMREEKITEEEAYSRLRKFSMDNRKNMREVAEAIILADEIKK